MRRREFVSRALKKELATNTIKASIGAIFGLGATKSPAITILTAMRCNTPKKFVSEGKKKPVKIRLKLG